MAYKYYGLVTSASPSSFYVNDFNAVLQDQFEVASDLFDILEEPVIGSGSFVDVRVRITEAVSSVTGTMLSDDFKQILFKDLAHDASLGKKYIFANNTWICVYSEIIKTLGANCMVRRCDNVLRWIDSDGIQYSEPAIIDYKVSRPRDLMGTENLVLPQGFTDVFCQGNARTKTIKGNQRFLFGPVENRIAFKIFGDGISNFLNQKTSDDTSATLLKFSMGGNFVNKDVDNLILGIADYYKNYSNLTSGSNIGTLDIVVSPNTNYVLESGSSLYDVRYYSGSTVLSGSFVFTVSGSNVPVDHYVFAQESNNTFSVYNIEKYLDSSLNILASGSSGSRILLVELRGIF